MANGNQLIETRTPAPGNLSHLDYLATLEAPTLTGSELPDFLSLTQACRSLGIIIKQERTYRPIRTWYIDFDSRLYFGTPDAFPRFTGSIYRNPNQQGYGHLILSGLQHFIEQDETRPYSAFIPIHSDLSHDPSRPADAVFTYLEESSLHKSIYNEAADKHDSRYRAEHDPQALVSVIQEASRSLLQILGYTPGELPKPAELKTLDEGYVRFHPGFNDDDPDQFLYTA